MRLCVATAKADQPPEEERAVPAVDEHPRVVEEKESNAGKSDPTQDSNSTYRESDEPAQSNENQNNRGGIGPLELGNIRRGHS